MNDLEDLVREEMSARVAAAEAAATDERPEALLADLARKIRLAKIRRRRTALALSAVAIASAVALPLTMLSSGPARINPLLVSPRSSVPLTDTAATPPGWAPVAYGDAQISVPASWYVQGPVASVCGGRARGMVFVGAVPNVSRFRGCGPTTSVAAIEASSSPVEPGRPATTVNGIGVVQVAGAPNYLAYVAPSLHVRVQAWGPLASRVIATITRSPLSVVLARGRPFPVPASWRWHDFGGIKFATPARWALVRNGRWDCGGVYQASVVLLAAHIAPDPGCVAPSDAASITSVLGVIATTSRHAGRYSARKCAGYDGRKFLNGLRACYSGYSGNSDEPLYVFIPGRQRATLVLIGLAGDGVVARTIFDSIRPG
jgi:hypothetical protein